MVLKQLKSKFSKKKPSVNVRHKTDGSFILNTIHLNNQIEFLSHFPVKSVLSLPTDQKVTLHEKDLVYAHHLRIQRQNGDVLKIFECPKKSFVVVELVKKPYFSLIIARSGKDIVVDGVDYSSEASNLLLKEYVSLFNHYKKILGVKHHSKNKLKVALSA